MIVYLLCYAASFLFARSEHYYLSGAALILAAGYLYVTDYRRSGNPLHLRGLFSAFWVGGEGIACLKLSKLQADWELKTWLCFLLGYLCFYLVFEILSRQIEEPWGIERRRRWEMSPKPLYHCIIGLTFVSLAAFIFEAAVLGYIPLLVRGVPHAYSEFHVTGVHYLTVSCVLVPSLTVLYVMLGGSRYRLRNVLVGVMTVISLAIPLLCVSRFQLIFAVMLALFTYGAYRRKVEPVYVLGLIVVMIPLYLLLTVARSHDVEYLNSIFEMKNQNMPIFISQPYIYIANNYENFNCLVEALPAHTFGIRMMFPLWALTGLKFLFPYLTSFPIYVNKAELTTVTLFYDSYYDFGVIGVVLFGCLLGFVAWLLVRQLGKMRNPVGYLLYAQFAAYMVLSFFTTWFSNPTTWFYLLVTGVAAWYCGRYRH